MRNGSSWNTEDYAYSDEIYVYRMTWAGDDEGEFMTYKEVVNYIAEVMVGEDSISYDEAKEILSNGGTVRIGPDEDWYRFTPLEEPMVMDKYGEIVTVQQRDDDLEDDDRGVVDGVDYPGSM